MIYIEKIAHACGNLVHRRLVYSFILRDAKIAKDAWAAFFRWQISRYRNDVKMNVRMLWMLGKLNDVGLLAANRFLQRLRYNR